MAWSLFRAVAGTLPLNTMAETLNYRPSTDNWYAMDH